MRTILLILVLLATQIIYAQKNCGTSAPPPGELENWIQSKINEQLERTTSSAFQTAEITIPVVVHVLHKGEPIGTGTNLSYERIAQQIDSLTADFRRINADTVNTPEEFKPIAADVEINFVLARQDPGGMPSNGIVRVNASDSFVPSRTNDLITMRSLSYWSADRYLNLYCADLGSGLIGYATFPETDGSKGASPGENRFYLDAVSMDFEYFGTNPNAPAFESRGRTLTHELGHFLGLRHIWGDGDCTKDDFIDDTPLADDDNGGYTSPCTFPNPDDNEICVEGEPEMFQNYMDYTDDICMNLFTEGQKEYMRVVAENSPRRASLSSSPGSIEPTIFENDLAIAQIISPDFGECDPQITPIVEFINYGTNEIVQFEVSLIIDGNLLFSTSKTTSLQPFETEIISFPNQIISGNSSTIAFRIEEVNNGAEDNMANNFVSRNLNYVSSLNLPFIQNFETGHEMLGILGANEAWNIVLAPEVSPSNRALVFQSYENNASYGSELILTTPPLDLNGVNTAVLSFKYAYSGKPGDIYDGLFVYGSTDCGANYADVLFSEVGPTLQTAIPTANEFIPSNELEWQEVEINISDYQDTDGVRFMFQGLNGSNNIYIDDITVEQTNILEHDISLESIQGPLVTCNARVDLQLEIKNAGSEPITSFGIEGTINGEAFSQAFDGVFVEYQEYENFQINISSLTQTENTIALNVGDVNGRIDQSVISNSVEASININTSQDDYPLTVDFENENLWINVSPQENSLWTFDSLEDNAVLRATSFEEQTLGIQSWYVSPALSTGGLDSAGLFFKLSYANRPGFNDQFRVLLSSDCGKLFDEVLMEANSDSLAVAETSDRWIPATADDWKEFSIDISHTIEIGDSIRIAFVMVNGNGNDLYLDDISIRGNEPATYSDVFRIYPNPATTNFSLGFNLPKKEPVLIEMIDMSGKLVISQVVPNAFNQIISFEVPKNPGLYFIRAKGAKFVQTQRLFVNSN